MKYIELLELRFYNIQSYGNNLNTFTFKGGVTWIMGPNGVGKSTIIEALTYVLFGTPYRDKVTLENLINTTNNKRLLVELDFIIHDSAGVATKYTVKRGMKPKIFSLEENGIATPRIAGINQAAFEEEILGFDARLFNNAISLNALETTPFIDMKKDEKRKFVESTISFDVSKLKKKIGSESSQVNVKLVTISNDIKSHSNKISDLNTILFGLEKEKEGNIQEFQNQVDSKKEILVGLGKSKDALKLELDKLLLLGKEVNKKLDTYKGLDEKLRNLEQVLSFMGDLESLKEEFSRKTTTLIEEEKASKQVSKTFEKMKSDYTTKQEALKKYDNLDQKIYELTSISNRAQKEMDRILKDQADIKVGVPCPACKKPSTEDDREHLLEAYREEYKKNSKILKESKKDLETLKAEKEESDTLKKEFDTIKMEYVKNEQIIISHDRIIKNIQSELMQISSQIDGKKKRSEALVPDFDIEKESKEPLLKKIEEYKKDKTVVDEINKEFSILKESGLKHRADLSNMDNSINSLNTEIMELESKIDKKKEKSDNDTIGVTKNQIKTTNDALVELHQLLKKTSDDIEILNYMGEMFGDEGIKKTIIGTFVPVLNKAIERNLKIFNLPFSIEFDESLDYIFHDGYGSAPVYHSLSQGQKRKLHFSISMAFRDFVTLIGDFKINVLFLDEVLDISVDTEGLENMIDVLKVKNKEIPSIYLMTHRGENFSDSFDNIIEIKHDGRFSEILEVR